MPILHVIPSFAKGGAENVLKKLLTSPDLKGDHVVVCLKGETGNSRDLETYGIKVFHLNLCLKKIFNIFKFKKILAEVNPRILQGWMYHSNFICFFVNIIYRGKFKVYWNIRNVKWRKTTTYGSNITHCFGFNSKEINQRKNYHNSN